MGRVLASEEQSEGQFLNYVQTTIEEYKNKLVKVREHNIYPVDIDKAIATYTKTSLDLLAISEKYVKMLDTAQEKFDMWYSQKFVEVRDKLTSDGRAKTKFPSQKEIEADIKATYKNEYLNRIHEVKEIEHKKNFIDKIIYRWDKEQFLLSALNNNTQVERRSLKMDQNS